MYSRESRAQIETELSNAQAAREQGLEGRARVCARRAAGIAVRAYLASQNLAAEGNAYDLLQVLQTLPGAPEPARRAAKLLVARVTEAYQLPFEADLIHEARVMITALEPEDYRLIE